MSDDQKLVPSTLLPPGVKDPRQEAFVAVLDGSLRTIDIQAFVMTDPMTVDAQLLPFMVREFSVQEFISTDLPDEYVRRFIAAAHDLHSKKGYVEGTRLGLRMLGIEVVWTQWWQENPKADHNTHIVTAFANENVFAGEGVILSAKLQAAILRVIDATKRWSQDITFQLGANFKSKVGAGAALAGLQIQHKTINAGRNTCFASQVGLGAAIAGLQIAHFTFSAQEA